MFFGSFPWCCWLQQDPAPAQLLGGHEAEEVWACCSGHHLTYATHATRDCDSVLDVKPTAAEAAWFSVSSGSGQWQAQAHLAGQVSDDVGYAAGLSGLVRGAWPAYCKPAGQFITFQHQDHDLYPSQ